MTLWQPLISHAAVSCFNRTGKVPRFRLAFHDMTDLCAQVMGCEPWMIRRDIYKMEGYVAMRCMVRCDALGTPIVVDEWRKT